MHKYRVSCIYRKLRIKIKRRGNEFLRFAIVGVISTLLHYGIDILLMKCIPLNVSYTIGYIVGFFANFLLTNYFTFHTLPTKRNLIGMAGAHVINYFIHLFLLNFFLFIGFPPKYAPIPVYSIAVPVNFLIVRSVFKNGEKTK